MQVAIELIKVVRKAPIEHYKNAFLNLALPLFVFSEPAPAAKFTLRYRDSNFVKVSCAFAIFDWSVIALLSMVLTVAIR